MAQDDPRGTRKEKASRRQADKDIRKDMSEADMFLLGQIQEVKDGLIQLAQATSFQHSLEQSLQDISSKLTPIRDMAPAPAPLDEDQIGALDRIRREVDRPPEPRLYVIERDSDAPGYGKGTAA